ncbi:unnamed protein product [Arabidopsis halleri]
MPKTSFVTKRTKNVAAFNLEEDMRRHQIKTASNRDKKLINLGTMQKVALLFLINPTSTQISFMGLPLAFDLGSKRQNERSGVALSFESEFEELVECQFCGISKPC